MTTLTDWEIFKKRWLFHLGFVFIYMIPGALILYQTITIKTSSTFVQANVVGLVFGVVYIAFVAKKIHQKMEKMKPGPVRVLLSGIGSIIPFATVGCLVLLVENSLAGFDTLAWIICVSLAIGFIMRAIEAIINKKFLYDLHIDELAHEKADITRREKELEAEAADE